MAFKPMLSNGEAAFRLRDLKQCPAITYDPKGPYLEHALEMGAKALESQDKALSCEGCAFRFVDVPVRCGSCSRGKYDMYRPEKE